MNNLVKNILETREKLELVESELLTLAHRFIEHEDSEKIMIARAHIMDAIDLIKMHQNNDACINFYDKSKSEIELIIESNKTPAGGWTKKTLESWGVSWPPPKGWKHGLINRGSDDKSS